MTLSKKISKTLACVSLISLCLNWLSLPLLVLAEETEPLVAVNDNNVVVDTDTLSDSDTGQNLIEESTEAEIGTGDALADSETENLINLNQVDLADLATPSATPAETLVVNLNQAEISVEATSSASTGQNSIESAAEAVSPPATSSAQISTGDAMAIGNVVNVVNTNIVGSQVDVYVDDILDGEVSSLDINGLWQDLAPGDSLTLNLPQEDGSPNLVSVYNCNQADLNNYLEVSASTGQNSINGAGEALIFTGSATALANVFNLVNTNIVGSNLFFIVLNIDASLLTDLILPSPESFLAFNPQSPSINSLVNSSTAIIENQVNSEANTGQNHIEESAEAEITTGKAISVATSDNIINLSLNQNNYYHLTINNLGNNSGSIYNWSAPGAIDTLSVGTNLFTNQNLASPAIGGDNPAFDIYNTNFVNLTNTVSAAASTGNNEINNADNAEIKTGPATAVSNLTNIVNSSIVGNNWFYGLINIIGDWKGNTIFAYPDLSVGLNSLEEIVSEGENISYALNYANRGQDDSQNTQLEFILPEGTGYLSDNSGFDRIQTNGSVKWLLGTLTPGQSGSFIVTVKTGVKNPLAWWRKIVPKAIAAENRVEISAKAIARTSRSESNTDNNQATARTKVVIWDQDSGQTIEIEDSQSSGNGDQRQPVIEISAKNNVNDFVYPGDVVTFEIGVKNTADVSAYDAYLVHEIFDQNGNLYRSDEIDVGQISAYKNGSVRFGVPLSTDTLEGIYTTKTRIYAYAQNDNEVQSNESNTEFLVKGRGIIQKILPPTENPSGEILGDTDFVCQSHSNQDILAYVLLFLESSAWLYYQSHKWLKDTKSPKKLYQVLLFLLSLFSFAFAVFNIAKFSNIL